MTDNNQHRVEGRQRAASLATALLAQDTDLAWQVIHEAEDEGFLRDLAAQAGAMAVSALQAIGRLTGQSPEAILQQSTLNYARDDGRPPED